MCAKILKGRRDAWRYMLKIELCRALLCNKVLRFFQTHDFSMNFHGFTWLYMVLYDFICFYMILVDFEMEIKGFS